MKLPTVTVAMIAKNEAHNLDAFFASIAPIADELVVAYSRSTDDTQERLEAWKAKAPYPVVMFEYNETPFHYGKARNSTLERSTCDFIFVLDADERIPAETAARLKPFLAEKNPHAVVMQRQDDQVPHLVDPQTRIVRNHGPRYATAAFDQLHEQLVLTTPPVPFDGLILHMQGANHWLNKHNRFFIELMRELDRKENTRGLIREIIRAYIAFFYKFKKEYFRKKAYLDGVKGLKYSFLRALHSFLVHFFVGLKPRVRLGTDGVPRGTGTPDQETKR